MIPKKLRIILYNIIQYLYYRAVVGGEAKLDLSLLMIYMDMELVLVL